jgi:rhodanese-related sulfurtransferase
MILIDVRTKGEYDAGHAEGAILHDIMDMMAGSFPNMGKDEEIILYCESGNRSMMAETLMKKAGFTNVTNGGSVENFT